jgi:peptidoglycan/LPS O-acetylase OafA/YrhL
MPKLQIVFVYTITLAIILFKKQIFYHAFPVVIERVILSGLFAFMIAEQNFAKNSFFKFSSFKRMSKLGIYTYGLYCMQFVGILVVQKLFIKLDVGLGNAWINISGCIIALALLIILSIGSYHLFEKYFLTLKEKFAVITKK